MIIVSACLAGVECRYDCQAKTQIDIVSLVKEGKAIPLCPEQLGGLSTPRTPAEQVEDKVITKDGKDVTSEFDKGAHEALKIALMVNAKEALLKSKSPMCGCSKVYSGSFSGDLKEGNGIFTKLLLENNIKVREID